MKKFMLLTLFAVVIIIGLIINDLSTNPNLIQTEERTFGTREPSYYLSSQDELINRSDLIFAGTHTRSVNYTHIEDDYGIELEEYYTIFYFKINKVYFGNENLVNKEIALISRNFVRFENKILLKENKEYIGFTGVIDTHYFDRTFPFWHIKPIYWFPGWDILEIDESSVLATSRILGYDRFETPEEVTAFRNAWVEKQAGEKIYDFSFENISSVLSIEEVTVDMEAGTGSRFKIDRTIFEDLLYDAINYYR